MVKGSPRRLNGRPGGLFQGEHNEREGIKMASRKGDIVVLYIPLRVDGV